MSPRKPHRRASGGSAVPAEQVKAADPAKKLDASTRPDTGPPAEPSVLKVRAADDDPRVWGDGPEDRDSWLLEQRPPHWD